MKMNLKTKTTASTLIALFLASILVVAFNIPLASADCPVSYPVIGPSTWTYEFNYVVDPLWVPDPMPLPGGVQDGFCFDKMTGVVSASVTGSAAAAGWSVGFVSSTTVVFDAQNVVGGGPWSGFNIYAPGMVDGPVDWFCDHGAGGAADNDLEHGPNPPEVGYSLHDILRKEWTFDMRWYGWGFFGSSSAIADLGVNTVGGDPNSDLEIVTGSDELWGPDPLSNGVWRAFDSGGNLEWQRGTQTDEARSSPVVVDLDGDGDLEIAGGTTSGWYFQVMDHQGNFVWTFPKLLGFYYGATPFAWPSSPAAADLDSGESGLELVIGNRLYGNVWCFDGDNTDGVDSGITITSTDFPWGQPLGSEGTDWDVLWKFPTTGTLGQVWATPAIGDVDNDGDLEVIIGATDGNVYVLDGASGTLEHTFATGGAVYASAALANLDADAFLEIVIGSTDGKIYCFQWNGAAGSTEWTYPPVGMGTIGAVYSSAAIGDIDNDGALEIVVGSNDNWVYALGGGGQYVWSFKTGGTVYSSPALAERCSVDPYDKDWPMFRNNPARTGLYGTAPPTSLDVYVGSDDGYLYLIEGDDGSEIDRFRVNVGPWYWPYGIHTSPVVADVDGDKFLEIFFYDWGQASAHGGHTYWALEDSIIRKEMTPTSGGLGTVVHITLHVGVPWQVTVKVIDTLPKQFNYIPGTFMVNGVPAIPSITLIGPSPGKHQQLSYTITELCHHVIEFDAKVVEARKEDWEVYNTAKVEWYKEDELYHEKEIVEPFVIKAFCELNKNIGIPKKVKMIPVPMQFWNELPGIGVSDIILFDPPDITEGVAIVRDYAVLSDGEGPIPLELLTWEGTEGLPWELIDDPEDPYILLPNEQVQYDIPTDPATTAVLVRYTVAWESSQDVIEAKFVNEAILEKSSPQVIVGQLSNFDVHNDYHEPVDNFELELYGIEPGDIVDWFPGWGTPPQINPIPGGTEVVWMDKTQPVMPCEWVHFGLHLKPGVIAVGVKAYWTQLEDGLVIKEKTNVQWRLEIEVTNPFSYTMTNVVITDRFGAEIEIDTPFPFSITQGTVSYTTNGRSQKVFLTWNVGDLPPGQTARLILLVSTDINPGQGDCDYDGDVDLFDLTMFLTSYGCLADQYPYADMNEDGVIGLSDFYPILTNYGHNGLGKQEYTEPGIYELNSGATLKFTDPDQDMQLSAYTDSIYVTVLPEGDC